MNQSSSEQWSNYWQKNTVTTFHNQFENNYDGTVKDFWCSIFELLKPDAKIVDLATGNGAIALLAAEFSEQSKQGFSISGIDYAEIDPVSATSNMELNKFISNIQFFQNTRIENTPFESNSIDLVTSQFGMEYSDLSKSLLEVERILVNGGVLAMMVHFENSMIIQQEKTSYEQYLLCQKSGLHRIARELLIEIAKFKETKTPNSKSEKLRQKFNKKLIALSNRNEEFKDSNYLHYYIGNISALFSDSESGQLTLSEKLDILNNIKNESNKFKLRMDDMINASMSLTDLTGFTEQLTNLGLSVKTRAPLYYNGAPFGYCVVAVKS